MFVYLTKSAEKFVFARYSFRTDKYVMHPSFQSFTTRKYFPTISKKKHTQENECEIAEKALPTATSTTTTTSSNGFLFFCLLFPCSSNSLAQNFNARKSNMFELFICVFKGKKQKN